MACLGALIYALGVNLFVVPLGLFTGGLMGLCQLLRSLVLMVLGIRSMTFDFAGLILLAFNVPLLILAYRSMGKVFFRNTLICPCRRSPLWRTCSPGACWGASSPGWGRAWP